MSRLRAKAAQAAICRQGHVVSGATFLLDPTRYCTTCGDDVLLECSTCQTPIPGQLYADMPASRQKKLLDYNYRRPGFCPACGNAYPWADREELVSELIKMVDQQELDPSEKLMVREQLEALADPDLSEEEQERRWARVRDAAPKVLAASGRIVERLVGEAMRQTLGL